ncbi:MAG: DNA polymerase III subunit alpha [Coxiella sp. DG_40]|nr:MAG: DNA polymerase III subunit alpha [Coxiella sp. DG_40]
MQPQFIHLHLHTEYSIVDGLVRIKPLLQACIDNNMPAVAVTDRCNFFGLVKFYRAAMGIGIKPIAGVDVLLNNDEDEKRPFNLTLLCQNQTGYRNIIRLISRSYTDGQQSGNPIILRSWLEEVCEGIIVLSGGRHGDIGHALLSNNKILAKQLLDNWLRYFPDRFYLELQRTDHPEEENYIQAAVDLAQQYSVPVVATNDVQFLSRDDFEAHEARVCIHDGYVLEDTKRPRLYSEQQYFRSALEMSELFADIPEAIENTVEIAKRCNLELSLGKNFLPKFPVPDNETLEKYFEQETKCGLKKRKIPIQMDDVYQQRLQHEIDVINQMGFAGYFLIVADFINWAKANDIPVGPGRGSGAGSLVAYSLGITGLDPIKHELLFERFLNPERVSMPDFDIDFCMEGRDRVIEYVADCYGRKSVSQIITFGTMAARAVVRDVGRVLGYPYGYVDKIAKLIPFELGITLEKALQQEERLAQMYKEEDDVKTLIDLAARLEGLIRNVGKHAGGVVISPSLLTDFTPLYCEPSGGNLVTQYDKGDVEAVGLVKFDFLGLRTLTIINWTLQTINAKRKQRDERLLDISDITLDDRATYELLKSCATTAIFQLESRGMRDLVKRIQPDCFDDIIAINALFRPGPLHMVDDFIERRHGRALVRFPHSDLKTILSSTYGVILYQEQVMQIAQVLAGYSLGCADLLRRAMGKKKPEEMAKQRAIFMEGAANRGVDKHIAANIFDSMEKFAGYGFNKSHSAGYALIAYQTAWLKTHYPAEFMAAVLSSDMDNTDKIVMFIEECRRMKLIIIPPHVNYSQYKFTVNEQGEIVYGLGAIKGIGFQTVENIVATKKRGLFKDLFDFCGRVDIRKINKRVLEALIRSGAFDNLGPHRASMFASISLALKAAEQHSNHLANGQYDLFADLISTEGKRKVAYVDTDEWNDDERLAGESEVLGLYLTGHPVESYESELENFITARLADLTTTVDQAIKIAGLVTNIKTLHTKNDKRMAIITLRDRTGHVDITVFSDVYQQYRDLLSKGQLLIIEGDMSVDSLTGSYRLLARYVFNIVQAREKYAECLLLKIDESKLDSSFINKLTKILKVFSGGKCLVAITYSCQGAQSDLLLGDSWQVKPTDELLAQLGDFLGKNNVVIKFRGHT